MLVVLQSVLHYYTKFKQNLADFRFTATVLIFCGDCAKLKQNTNISRTCCRSDKQYNNNVKAIKIRFDDDGEMKRHQHCHCLKVQTRNVVAARLFVSNNWRACVAIIDKAEEA